MFRNVQLKPLAAEFMEKGDLNCGKFLEAEQTSLVEILSIEWSYISASPIRFCGVNRKNFTIFRFLSHPFRFYLSYRLYIQSY